MTNDQRSTEKTTTKSDGGEVLPGVPLIDRDILFGNPERTSVRVSADGTQIAFLAPSPQGVLNVWVAPWEDPDSATQVTDDTGRGIRSYSWAYDNEHILYVQDRGGDENWHIFATHLASGETRDLTPHEEIQARIVQMSAQRPGEFVVAINDRNPQFHELYLVEIATGDSERIQENEEFVGFVVDESFAPRLGLKMSPAGTNQFFDVTGEEPELFLEVEHEDTMTTNPVDVSPDGESYHFVDSRGRDTAALTSVDVETGETTLLFQPEKADVAGLMRHPQTHEIEAVSWNYERQEWHFFDDRIERLVSVLGDVEDGDVEVTSRSHDDRHWVVAYLKDDGPVEYYTFDTETEEATFAFTDRSELEGLPLVTMEPVLIAARDGLELVSYLSLPPDVDERPTRPCPMVLLVHGGPWARDEWGYNALHQWLANRGYAVLSVNFRGSTGFGKAFIGAADKAWGREMHDDLLDAVEWAVDEGIADPDRVAIMGGSYGGYATLWGLTNTPEVFAAGVDIVGPSSLITLLESIPPYWEPVVELFARRVGDPRTEEGRALLEERSPLTWVDQIEKPLLIGQGANDPRVKQAESDQIVSSMQSRNLPVTYVLYPDEGHGFARPENRLTFFGVAEAFLAQHLGGRHQELTSFANSSIHVPEGAEEVPGLRESLCEEAPERCRAPE